MDNKELKIAYHESSHAVMALLCRQKIQFITLKETDRYQGHMKLVEAQVRDAISDIRISLAGGVGESLFLHSSVRIAIDDMDRAIAGVTNLLEQDFQFRGWAVTLRDPGEEALNRVENPLVRACIARFIEDCADQMLSLKPVIHLIAEELFRREELTGDEVSALFLDFMKSREVIV